MRISALFTVLLLLVMPLLGAEPAPPPDQVLKVVLELDESQLARLQGLMEARRDVFTRSAARMAELRVQLEQALNQPEPDPASVGSLIIAIRGLERETAQHQENFRTQFQQMLTDEQFQRMEVMKMVRAAFVGGTALEELGL